MFIFSVNKIKLNWEIKHQAFLPIVFGYHKHWIKMLENTISSLKELNSKEFILYHHLGLGDSIVCNGMVNYLTQKNKMFIHLPSNTKNFSSLEFLYSDNPNVKVFEIEYFLKTRRHQTLGRAQVPVPTCPPSKNCANTSTCRSIQTDRSN